MGSNRVSISEFVGPDCDFNPHPRVGSNGIDTAFDIIDLTFQSTSPCGEQPQTSCFAVRCRPYLFQSTSPCGEQPRMWTARIRTGRHFNPHPRVGSNFYVPLSLSLHADISIHIPVWGATEHHPVPHRQRTHISIHIPVWGATLTREASRDGRFYISIHIPVWGATSARIAFRPQRPLISIHIPVWGATPLVMGDIQPVFPFQSTSPCGEQHEADIPGRLPLDISIHIPVWGATWIGPGHAGALDQFQSTSPCGEQPVTVRPVLSWESVFQSTSPCGEQPG